MEAAPPIMESTLHPIHFFDSEDNSLESLFSTYSISTKNTLIVSDSNAHEHTVTKLKALKDYTCHHVPTGESCKNLTALTQLYDTLSYNKIDRHGALIGVGGGAVEDLAGLAASTYLRGIRLFHIPTTLLAMVDSSIGGKNGINFQNTKNQIGTVYLPSAIFINPKILKSLPIRFFNSGMGEVIKYGILNTDLSLDYLIKQTPLTPDSQALPEIIQKCIVIKEGIVKLDLHEKQISSPRMQLNLGHTFAHAIESVDQNNHYLHGEAVGIGLLMATQLSKKLGVLEDNTLIEKLEHLLQRCHLPLKLEINPPLSALMQAMKKDKKAIQSQPQLVLIRKAGDVFIEKSVPESLVIQTWLENGAIDS